MSSNNDFHTPDEVREILSVAKKSWLESFERELREQIAADIRVWADRYGGAYATGMYDAAYVAERGSLA